MVNKNKRCIVVISFWLFLTTYGMEPKKLLKKVSERSIILEPINSNDLPSLSGSFVLWKKNSNDCYLVRLGERIGTTDFYKIYYSEQSGGSCQLSELYRYKSTG